MTTEICHGCGSDKQLVDREPKAVWWMCPTCGLSREELTQQ